jgi:hypothetical protein
MKKDTFLTIFKYFFDKFLYLVKIYVKYKNYSQ